MTLDQALQELNVAPNSLSAGEREQFDRDGFINLGQLVTPNQAREMAYQLDEIARIEGEKAGKDFHTEAGTTRLGSLLNKHPIFDQCFLHPRILAALDYVSHHDFGLSSLTARTALAGEGEQGLHVDWMQMEGEKRVDPPTLFAANALWLLDDFTPENGPTRIIPGSHKGPPPTAEQSSPQTRYPNEYRLIAPAGTVVVNNAYTWHAGTRNNTNVPRHLVSAMFQPRNHYQPFAYRKLEPAAQKRLSAAAKFIADHPYAD